MNIKIRFNGKPADAGTAVNGNAASKKKAGLKVRIYMFRGAKFHTVGV